MRITQNYNGTTSHKPHTTGSPKDYPIDEGGKDSGRDGLYCDCDEMKIVRLYGAGNGGTNTLWVESTSKVHFADGTCDYACGMAIHPNDSDFKSLYVGKKFKRGELICREGSDGATANHLHISFGKGKLKGNGWKKNSKGKYVLDCTGGAHNPEKLFYIDPSFTKVMSKGGIPFKTLPKTLSKAGYTVGKYKVDTELLKVRTGAGTAFPSKKFENLRDTAQKKILALKGFKQDGYVRGLEFTVKEVNKNWGKTGSGWVCLDYCEKI